uniref:lysophospholipase n=1 Tax=Phallusia mammillata TaxID=59560 RepID=A0A6F9DNF5_9ASCI|nr:patatin-like phospholipase domain-containing protein 7 [Phallusia mammillata]
MESLQTISEWIFSYMNISWITGMETSPVVLWVGALITLIAAFLTFTMMLRSRMQRPVVAIPEIEQNKKYRFRKRDKMQFYANKVLRKGRDTASRLQRQVSIIKDVPEYSRSGRRLDNRERMMILAKMVFSKKKSPSFLQKKELPSVLLEADQQDEGLPNLPEEVLYLLQSVKVFGHFKQGVFFQLCRHMETLNLNVGDSLFQVGEDDKWLYVVQEGQINLYITEDSTEIKLSEITEGETLHSLLSILDVLTGHMAPYKTVFARAVKKSIVLRLPAEAFIDAFRNRNESLVQMVQVIMTRMQRVTFLALHNYLGLSQELLNPTKRESDHRLSIRKISSSAILNELAEKHNLSASDITSQLVFDDTVVKAKVSGLMVPTVPLAIKATNKTKQIRFNDIDTVVDDNDNVFHRQSSLPSDEKKKRDFRDLLKQAQSASAESFNLPKMTSQVSMDSEQSEIFELDEPEVLELVTNDLCEILGLEDRMIVQSNVTLLKVSHGHQLIQQGDQDVCLYFVVAGNLRVLQTLPEMGFDEQREVTLFVAKPGMLTGQLAVLTGEPSFFCVRALSDSVIARITKQGFYRMMRKYPRVVLNTAHTVMMRVSPFVRQIDFALDWVMIEAGKPLYKQDSYSDCMYIVLHGRLRSVIMKPDGKKEMCGEFGKGEIVGMTESIRGSPRTASLHAIRDTELAKIPEGLVKHIRRRHPGIVTRLISLMSDKLLGNMMSQKRTEESKLADALSFKPLLAEETRFAYGDVSNHLANLSTVAILPASKDVPLDKFSMELQHAMTHICPQALRLSSGVVKKRLGNNALDAQHEYRLSNWLAHHEDLHQMVLYQTDFTMTTWTHRCVRQADAVLIVALGDGEPSVGELESQLEGMAVRALKMLVLLHRPNIVRPTRTVEWLNMRGWLNNHIHIKGPKRLFARTRKSKLEEYWEKLIEKSVDRFSDFSRLARFLTGTSVALVLGGGGARGLSQIGIIRSLLNAGIPIDMVGGTSIGAFMGALWSAHRDIPKMREKTMILCDDMGSILGKILDLTYPYASMFSGSSFNRAIENVFKELQIEDLWLPFFTISTDITSSKMRVHTDGWLWRYVRASMSLSGYLPPLCDPKDGHLLMDGGYINNLPGDVARSRGACKVLAVDVGSESELDLTNYGDHLSGWWVLWKKWTGRWTGRVKVPDMNEIQSRLSYISCQYILEKVRQSDYCCYIRPPVVKYKTLDFNKHEELYNVGLSHGSSVFTEEMANKFWQELLQHHSDPTTPKRTDISFTDLSEYFTEFDGPEEFNPLSDSDYELEYDSSPEIYSRRTRALPRLNSEPRDMHKMSEVLEDCTEAMEECLNGDVPDVTGRTYDKKPLCSMYSSEEEDDIESDFSSCSFSSSLSSSYSF